MEGKTMKKIAVVAANGKEGRLITEEAVKRGFDVTAVVRSENRTAAQNRFDCFCVK